MSTDYESVGDIRCNPWVSYVVPPIKQNLLFLNFQKMSRQRYEMQKFCLLRLKIDRE